MIHIDRFGSRLLRCFKGKVPFRKSFLGVALLTAITIFILLAAGWFLVTQPIFMRTEGTTTMAIGPARLETHVRMLSEAFVPRDWKHPENLDRAAEYIHKEFEHAKGAVSEQPYEMDRRTYRNVIAAFGPDTAERIVVGAHYDAFGEFPAADDNASGVAGLIELGYLLGNNAPPIRVELVAYTLEEPRTLDGPGLFRSPYGGSAVHAASLKGQGASVRIMFSLEMIGYFRDGEGSQGYPNPIVRWLYPSQGNFILVVGKLGQGWAVRRIKKAMRRASPLPVCSINAPAFVEGIDYSDHYNYWKAGYPAVMITDTAFNRNRNYHTAQDTWERLDYNRMAMVVQGVHAAVLAFAQ